MEPATVAKLMRNPTMAYFILKRFIEYALRIPQYVYWSVVGNLQPKGVPPRISQPATDRTTAVDSFWSRHTVVGFELATALTAEKSLAYVDWRSGQYPLFEELMGLWGDHEGKTVLDYGCGPGTDLVGFLFKGKATNVIGVDISLKALRFASNRIALHNIESDRVQLIRVRDSDTTIPLPDNTVDFVYSQGVLHHTSDPGAILKEIYRVLKPGATGALMIYNHDSIYLNLYVAYELMVRQGKYPGMNICDAFARTTDTDSCPLARCYTESEFGRLCREAGFETRYMGGYFSILELNLLKDLREEAISDKRLALEHRLFLASLRFDNVNGYPLSDGYYAGVGGSYRIRKGV